MPDLDRPPVLDWVAACAPELIAWCSEPVRAIEDEEGVRLALVALGQVFDLPALQDDGLRAVIGAGDAGRDLHAVLLQLGPARLMRLLRWLGAEGGPERAGILEDLLDGTHGSAQGLRTALAALHRRELLDRIFDEDRLQLLLAATNAAREGEDA